MIELYTKVGQRLLRLPDPFFSFPGGEIHMKNEPDHWSGYEIAVIRLSSGEWERDLFKLQLWAETVDSQGGSTHALIPYIPGARADRGVPLSGNRYAHMINLAELNALACFDIHSIKAHLFYNDLVSIDVSVPVAEFLNKRNVSQYHAIVAPDAGAESRSRAIANLLDLPLITATKKRNPNTGELSDFNIDMTGHEEASRLLIVDDICDGGGTFNGLAQTIRRQAKNVAILDLFVTHGLFSKTLSALRPQFNNVFTTDSIPGASARFVPDGMTFHEIPLIPDVLKNI